MWILGLASVGLFGMVSYDVSRRTRELGIRLSLGADRGTILRGVVQDTVRVTLIGGLVGFVLSLVSAHLVASFLVGARAFDPMILAGVPILLIGVSVLASVVPAVRASRVSPASALSTDPG